METKSITAVRILKFDSGHRVVGHEGKCSTLHGHEYKAHIYARAIGKTDQLDKLGRVIDFSVIKEKLGKWIDENLDHNMIIWESDPNLKFLSQCEGEKKIFVTTFNPTAENIADYLLNVICPSMFLKSNIEIYKIKLFETTNCYVEVSKYE